jgi:hypothetical protein
MSNALDQPASGGKRLIHLDALRGLFLVMMAIDHIPSEVEVVTNHPWGFVSAAEGFVFMAGLMAGLIYTKKLALASWPAVVKGTRQRAAAIYGWHVAVYLIVLMGVVATVRLTGEPPGGAPEQMAARPWLALLAGPTLLYQPGMMDVLPLYCLLFLLLPSLLRLLESGHRRVLMLGSFALWAATNVWHPQSPISFGIVSTGAFSFGAWQLVFVTGVVFGHAWARGETLLSAPRAWVIVLLLITGGLLWANRRGYFAAGLPHEVHHWLTNKNNLAPLRLLNTVILFYLGYLVLSRFPGILRSHALAALGRHSIAVFSMHVVAATAINAMPQIFATTKDGMWLGTTLMLASLYVAAGLHASWQRLSPRNRAIPHSPAVQLGDIRAT